jgi:hydroxymethylglutaryl-CoA lyase
MNIPKTVTVVEVGPRDGFQMEKEFIPSSQKIEIVNALVRSGLRFLEVASFVSPKAIPQMRDAAEVVANIERVPGLHLAALVPNPRGAENAAKAQIDEMVLFVSASASHNKSNVNRTIEESLEGFKQVAEIANDAGIAIHGAIAVAFGCPFEGNIPLENIGRILERMQELGIREVTLGDTTGMATPVIVRRTCGYLNDNFPEVGLSLHFHNTRGIGLVNVFEALCIGYSRFESAVGGLGGCPFAPGASGNICTEDLVYLMNELGVETGVDLTMLIDVAKSVERVINRPLPGQVMKAGPRLQLHNNLKS